MADYAIVHDHIILMTYKTIRYSSHAVDRMRSRRIRRGDVQRLLATGRPDPSQVPGQSVHTKRGMLGHQEAIIVYREGPRGIYVVTVMWAQ